MVSLIYCAGTFAFHVMPNEVQVLEKYSSNNFETKQKYMATWGI